MPRAAGYINHRENFTDVGNGKWLCNICKADVMTLKQAMAHESSAQHSSRAEAEASSTRATSSAMRRLTSDMISSLRRAEQERYHWTDLSPNLVSFWRRGLAAAERGEEAESMHDYLDKLEEELAEQSSQGHWGVEEDGWGWGAPAEDWTPTPDVWESAWAKPVAEVPTKVQKVHRRREGSSITSMHREGSIFNQGDAHDDQNEDDATSFVEKYLQRHAVDARRGERMRIFYEMPTEQKIRKIQEVIHDLRGQ